jgi:hypothetical protein
MKINWNRRRRRPTLELLEGRLALSTVVPANTVSQATGDVSAPRSIVPVTAEIGLEDLSPGRRRTNFGSQVIADDGSGLVPKVVKIVGADGRPLAFQPGSTKPTGTGTLQSVGFFKASHPGPVTIDLTGVHGTSGGFTVRVYRIGEINGDKRIDVADLKSFSAAYLTVNGDGLYNRSADANVNNFIGQNDGYGVVTNLTPMSKPRPLSVKMSLAPGDQDNRSNLHNSGGITSKNVVTIIGRTTPGSLILTDSGLADYSFTGPAIYANANGYFAITQKLTQGITNTEFKIIDPFGNRIIHAFPILKTNF